MGNHRCFVCGCNPGPFLIWTSSRVIDREKLMKMMGRKEKYLMKTLKEGVPVCFGCSEDLKNY